MCLHRSQTLGKQLKRHNCVSLKKNHLVFPPRLDPEANFGPKPSVDIGVYMMGQGQREMQIGVRVEGSAPREESEVV